MLSRHLQWNRCLGFGGIAHRALKGTYSEITGAGLYPSDKDPSERSASTSLILV